MKRLKAIGVAVLCLAALALLTGVASLLLRGSGGPLSGMLAAANEVRAASAAAQEATRAAQGAQKQANTAVSAAQKAVQSAQEVQRIAQEVADSIAAPDASDTDALQLYADIHDARASAEEAQAALRDVDTGDGNAGSLGEAQRAAQSAADSLRGASIVAQGLLLEALGEAAQGAREDLAGAFEACDDAAQRVNALLTADASEAEVAIRHADIAVEPEPTPLENYQVEAGVLLEQSERLQEDAQAVQAAAQRILEKAQAAQAGITVSRADSAIEWLQVYHIMIWFTAALLLLIGVVFTFFPAQFLRTWKKTPVFSTFIALVVMLILQVYSMKFTYASFGEWAKFWFDNAFNVLRANTSVGIIALGMTMVIITGGIDLAVGSTLAGVGTVVMVLIDTSSHGVLASLGITGVPAFCLGILGGFLTGALIGALIGLGVTKGRVPPFIITLGVMNIVRSLSQYFTKSYMPKVPPEFTAISNTVIFGQRLLPILYWLVLAVILYIVMNRTRFGRYVYAVGSNERTTRLSGINVDWVKFKVYTLMGFLVSIASIMQVSRLGGMDVASSGSGYELDAIAAVVVGGTSMSGGRGSILGTVIGVLIIGVMNNLLILLGVDSFLTNAFKGAIVVAAVLMQRKEKEA